MPRITKPPRKGPRFILLPALAVLFLGGMLYLLLSGGSTKPEKAIETATSGWEQVADFEPGSSTPSLTQESSLLPGGAQNQTEGGLESCPEAYRRISDFFSHLDGRPYISLHQLEGKSEQHVAGLLAKLYANPPVVIRETDNLASVLRNTAHFYRLLGKRNLSMAKEILQEESKIMEATLADFYRWSLVAESCEAKDYAIRLPLADLYEYSAFFLNTLGGQTYLLRRTPDLRVLTRYYSVLVLDRANELGLNHHGLDIRPALDSLIGDLEATQSLTGREQYLSALQALKVKYHTRYGSGSEHNGR